MNKNCINPEILDEYLNSARNAADKGQAQYLTPVDLASLLALPLPAIRSCIVDLNSGSGNLLRGAVNATTGSLLACDIDPAASKPKFVAVESQDIDTRQRVRHVPFETIIHDITLLAALLEQVDFKSDLFVLNPPWDLHWYRSRLNHLADSSLPAVAQAFASLDPRLGKDTIDSSVATLMLALHHCSPRGEGLLITNAATADRLLGTGTSGFNPYAPHRALAKHIWAAVRFPMDFFSGKTEGSKDGAMAIALYFARDHTNGIRSPNGQTENLSIASWKTFDRFYRDGLQVRYITDTIPNARPLWESLRLEIENRREGEGRRDFNLYLSRDGRIRTHLSLFDQAVIPSRSLQREADELKSLESKTPMSLVTQRNMRDTLMRAAGVGGSVSPWRVDPTLIEAIEQSLRDYHSVRAPLYPLPKIQRLGYLEEQDRILCVKDLASPSGDVKFSAGQSYRIACRTITVTRKGSRPNLNGELEDIEYTGAELATFITGDDGKSWSFLEARLKSEGVTLKDDKDTDATGRPEADVARKDALTVDFTLHQLVDHFEIPDVPDISTSKPDLYQQNLLRLAEIQSAMPAHLKFKKFQIGDYARIACTDGAILAHDPGLGKTWAALVIALLKCGFDSVSDPAAPLRPARLCVKAPVLLVAPGDLHQQMIDEAFAVFGITITRLDSHASFLRLAKWSGTRRYLPAGFYISSFTQLGRNGVEKYEPKKFRRLPVMDEEDLETIGRWNYETGREGEVLEVQQKIRCLFSPALVDLCGDCFDCAIVDEATKMKSDDSLIGQAVRRLEARYRFALTATPIKNRVPDIFWLAWWTAGGNLLATPRFPFGVIDKNQFSEAFCVEERNLTKEEKAKELRAQGIPTKTRFRKLTPQVCNIHRLWKLISPMNLRRRKRDIGETIVPKKTNVIRVPMGTAQAEAYKVLLDWQPLDKNGRIAVGRLLQSLRLGAAAPHHPSFMADYLEAIDIVPVVTNLPVPAANANDPVTNHTAKAVLSSLSVHTPKTHAALNLILQCLRRREQVILFAPFQEPLATLRVLLEAAGIPAIVMDGATNPIQRAELAREFKKGPRVLPVCDADFNITGHVHNPDPSKFPVALAGTESMAEGHNFFRCANGIHYSYSWALDKILQSDDRYHRLTSLGPVNSYRLVTDGSIDRKMESQIDEKADSAELILDGHLLGEQPAETNLADLLRNAQRDFDPNSKTMPESALKQEWDDLRQKLRAAHQYYLQGAEQPAHVAPTLAGSAVKQITAPAPVKSGQKSPPSTPLSLAPSVLDSSSLLRLPGRTNWRALIQVTHTPKAVPKPVNWRTVANAAQEANHISDMYGS